MAKKRQQPNRQKKIQPEVPADGELSATSPGEEPQLNDALTSMLDFVSEPDLDDFGYEPDTATHPQRFRSPERQSPTLQKALLVCIAAVAGVLAYTVFKKILPASSPAPLPSPAPVFAPQHALSGDPTQQSPATPEESAIFQRAELSLPRPKALSLQVAETFYLEGDFENALATYERLYQGLPTTEGNQPLKDFLLFKMALCSKRADNVRQADDMFRALALSRLPILRALARYHQSATLVGRQRYLEAASRAYQTIALVEVVGYDPQWAAAVQQQCDFLVAEALTRNVLSLRDADADLPPSLWGAYPEIDPFVDLDELRLKVLLSSGSKKLDEALLSPQIRPIADNGKTPRWSVTCNGASVEELLARFGSHAKLNIHWMDNGRAALDEETGRKKPVYLHMMSSTAQQVVTVAAGSVGLLARMDNEGNVTVLDPSSYASLADHIKLLADESVSLWKRFLLTTAEDKRVPSGHFALGLLHTARDRLDEAIAEFKLVANRFSKHALAPHALLHSGRLKANLRDYVGAHEDLKQLVELYPDTELSDRACLDLADATMKAGLYDEATDLYRKVFNLGLSLESQMESALGAGRCFYGIEDYEAAAKWLNHYVTLTRDRNRREFHTACLLLGKTYLALNKPQQAHAALNLALRGDLSRQQHVETIATLVKTYILQGQFIEALGILEATQAWQLSQQETVELLLLRAEVLRSIGLVEKAIVILADRVPFLPSPELKGMVALALAECYAEKGELELARETLSETFTLVEPGPLAQQIGGALAQIFLRIGRPEHAVSVCSQLLEYTPAGAEREHLLNVQADAYRRQRQYDRALSALLDQHDTNAEPKPAIPASTSGGG